MKRLPRGFPYRNIFSQFLKEYSQCTTYWYIPKARTLNDDNIQAIRQILKVIFDQFLGEKWDTETQDNLLQTLRREHVVDPYRPSNPLIDRTALSRIWKKLIEYFGLLWIKNEDEIVITDVGLDVLASENPRHIFENQIAKLQYPNPSVSASYVGDFKGLLPHLFLLQALKECEYEISYSEYEHFINLAQCHEDLNRILKYIECWREITPDEESTILEILRTIPMGSPSGQLSMDIGEISGETGTRLNRIHLNGSYQRSVFVYPSYLRLDSTNRLISCDSRDQVDGMISRMTQNLKLTEFSNEEDWFAYFGDPEQKPSWFTYLIHSIEISGTEDEASEIVRKHISQVSDEDKEIIHKKQLEKKIEDLYASELSLLEDGLTLVDGGRQYSTPIGRIDLLCMDSEGVYVVVEIKATGAEDAVFGQILRYIGWIHRNFEDGRNNVRGIILAGKFSQKARYSRIGLLKRNHRQFLKFKEHKLIPADV